MNSYQSGTLIGRAGFHSFEPSKIDRPWRFDDPLVQEALSRAAVAPKRTVPHFWWEKRHTHLTQIDPVVVSAYGIFVIETKNFSGWIVGSTRS